MNSLHQMYIETIFGIKIGAFTSGVAEFTGHLSLEEIKRLVAESGTVFWQEPLAEVHSMAYLCVPVEENTRLDFAVDFDYNIIYIA